MGPCAQKWAYVLTLLFIGTTVAWPLIEGDMVRAGAAAAVQAFVWVPLLICADWYWGAASPHHTYA